MRIFMEEKKLLFSFEWNKATLHNLILVQELLQQMHALAKSARSGGDTSPENILAFEEKKRALSELIDGRGGAVKPLALFQNIPLFLGMLPVTLRSMESLYGVAFQPINLYTGYATEGFFGLTLRDPHAFADESEPATLLGAAKGGSQTEVRLDHKGSLIDDAYAGMQITFTEGPGAHQKASIISYDGITQTAQFMHALEKPVGLGSGYLIESSHLNEHLYSIDGNTRISIATSIFGADNYREDLLYSNKEATFQALTDEESLYRLDQDILQTDLFAHTQSEKMRRRMLYIFDPDFGTIHSQETAQRMSDQTLHALDQIARLILNQRQTMSALHAHLPEHIAERAPLVTL